MEEIAIPDGAPSENALEELSRKCKAALEHLRSLESEVRLPLVIEFSGSPKSGKTTIIGIISHFLKRMGATVLPSTEGASLRTPPGLRDDWLAFNAWSGCYALQQILVDCSLDPPADVVILDRGLFDVAGWMEFLSSSTQRLAEKDKQVITDFFLLDLWGKRENGVFLFTADTETSLRREEHSKLTKDVGSVMKADVLGSIRNAYKAAGESRTKDFAYLYHVDTSDRDGKSLNFQQIAYQVAIRIVNMIQELSVQMLLVSPPVPFEGFIDEKSQVERTINDILREPHFLERDEAEKTTSFQQIVPYAVLVSPEGRYFWARRRSDTRRKELQGRWTLLVGGHAEKRDYDRENPRSTFERCLRRELDEELIGLQVLNVEPLGFISDTRSAMGSHHLAYIHRVKVGGRTSIRRQAIDNEFGRGSIEWKAADEIIPHIDQLDPWSQFVAAKLFGTPQPNEPRLFGPNSVS